MLKNKELQTQSNAVTDCTKGDKTTDNLSAKTTDNKENYTLIWAKALLILEKQLKPITFKTWINKLKLIDIQADIAVISVKNEFTRNFIQQSYIKVIQEALKEVEAKSYAIRIDIDPSLTNDFIETKEESSTLAQTEQKSLASLNENNTPKLKANINNNISLEKTYIGNFNQTCYRFSKILLEDLNNIYSSLFIHSASGLGKSHFLNMIGNESRMKNSNLKIKYLSSETFINELIMSIQKNRTQIFRDKYRDLDILLFDDFQFLEKKKSCQEEFIHTYESITKNGGKVIIACAKSADELSQIDPKLISILKSSLVTSIEEPKDEDRKTLIDFKLKELKIKLSDQHRSKVYDLDTECIRELQGNLLQISALQNFSNSKELNSEEFSELFSCNFTPSNRGVSIEYITEEVAKYFHLKSEDLTGRKRNEEFTKARHISIYLAYNLLSLSYKRIGKYFSDRKHSSIIHSIKTIESSLSDKLPSSSYTQKVIQDIKMKLNCQK